jgi:[acyl-carrier-protein] S-malonyltransferase
MRDPVAILCSGQAGQHTGMFDLLADCPEAEPVFVAASKQLGQDPRRFVREASPADLFANRAGQILCCTQALAVWAALADSRPVRAVFAGYSVGELAAWGCAGAIDMPATLRLAKCRAAAMDAVAPAEGGLAGIVGLSRTMLEPILRRHATAVAIVNDTDSFVIGGSGDGLDASCQEAVEFGATHTVRLPVALPSHTTLLAGAVGPFRVALHEAAPRPTKTEFRLLSGIDGTTVLNMNTGCEKLALQICTPIDWAATMESCRAAGVELALELGPGTALSRMAAPLFPAGCVRSTEEFRTIAGLRAWLSRANVRNSRSF